MREVRVVIGERERGMRERFFYGLVCDMVARVFFSYLSFLFFFSLSLSLPMMARVSFMARVSPSFLTSPPPSLFFARIHSSIYG
jgi:hypothetical protein